VLVNGQLHAALPPGTEPLVPIGKEVGEPQSRFGRGGDEKLKLGIIYYYGAFNKDKKVKLSLSLTTYQATNMFPSLS
jgi:hypothetical protein